MSSVKVRRVSLEDIQLVQNLIERCLQLYMSQDEVKDTLLKRAKIEPDFTELVWQRLEEENREFFKAYYLRLIVKQQITEYNRLLEQQFYHMLQFQPTEVSSIPNLPSMNQQQPLRKESDQSHVNGATVLDNRNSIQSLLEFSRPCRRIIDPNPLPTPNMISTNMPLMQQDMIKTETTMEDMIKTETTAYAAPYMYNGEVHSGVGSFSNESSNQSFNDPIVNAEASTFTLLGQIPRNFSISDLIADSEILESYDKSPSFLENFLDSEDNVENQGDNNRLGIISDSFDFENLGNK